MLKLATGKYDLIEREEIDERLKKLSYRMIKTVVIHICLNNIYIYIYIKKSEERVKISEILEEDVLKKGIEKINRDKEMEGLKKEIRKRDEEIKKLKDEIKKTSEENKKMKQEIEISQQQLKRRRIVDDDEKCYNILFTLYFFFCFSVFGLEIVNHTHPERFSLCGNILSFKADGNPTTIYLKLTITSVC
jgi:hypothetical protein